MNNYTPAIGHKFYFSKWKFWPLNEHVKNLLGLEVLEWADLMKNRKTLLNLYFIVASFSKRNIFFLFSPLSFHTSVTPPRPL